MAGATMPPWARTSANSATRQPAPQVTWQEGLAEEFPYQKGEFDVVVCQLFGEEAPQAMSAPFEMGDPATIQKLASEAKIPDAQVVTHRGLARFPSPK